KDVGCMFLFTTATEYPHYDGTDSGNKEALLSPFKAFTYRYHNGDFSASARDLYNQGFGDRLKIEIKEKQSKLPDKTIEIKDYLYNKEHLSFPIDIFPKPFQNYIIECNDKLRSEEHRSELQSRFDLVCRLLLE